MNNPLDGIPHIFTSGLSQADFVRLTDPNRDPALVLPDFEGDTGISHGARTIPSIDEIEAALNNHVLLGIDPSKMIGELLYPFVSDESQIDLTPGKGQKRLNYTVYIRPYKLTIGRYSTRTVAEHLRSIADTLSQFEIGKYTSTETPVMRLSLRSNTEHHYIKSSNPDTLRDAYFAVFGHFPEAIHINLSKTAEDILPHIFAAREMISQKEAKLQEYRHQASCLIRAVEDLRMMATVALRSSPTVNIHDTYFIKISLGSDIKIDIQKHGKDRVSAHEELAWIALHDALRDALIAIARKHPVLEQLPDNLELQMNGDTNYLVTDLIDTTKSDYDPKTRISLVEMEYKKLNSLAESLRIMLSPQSDEISYWKMNVTGHLRTKNYWNLEGSTLAHAFARDFEENGGSLSLELQDLLTDLFVDSRGKPSEVVLYRVIPR